MRMIIGIAAVVVLAGCSQQGSEEAAPTEGVSKDDRPAAFAQCAVCHQVNAGAAHGLGPNLWGVFGAKAGAQPGYVYSPSMKAAGLVWDEKGLDSFLINPRLAVPGTKMSYAGLADSIQRAEIVAWLAKQK